MRDLVSLGELLVDFTPVGESAAGNPVFERNPGGGPANLTCAAARLGVNTAFIGQVGDDAFGRALKGILADNRVDVGRLRLSSEYQTTLAFVHLSAEGERSFSFYRRQGADTMLTPEEADFALAADCRCFFYSSVLMTGGPSRQASFQLASHAREKGAVTVYDPNLRLNLWDSAEEARTVILSAMQWADIVKVSEEELVFLTGEPDLDKAARQLKAAYGIKALLATLGADGCFALVNGERIDAPGFAVKTVDTTGGRRFLHRRLPLRSAAGLHPHRGAPGRPNPGYADLRQRGGGADHHPQRGDLGPPLLRRGTGVFTGTRSCLRG